MVRLPLLRRRLLLLLVVAFALVALPSHTASRHGLERTLPRWYHPVKSRASPQSTLLLRGGSGANAFGGLPTTRPFKYFGGYVITGNPNITIHVVYYGAWADDERKIINNFLRSLGGYKGKASEATVYKWWAITTQYYLKRGGMTKPKYITNQVSRGMVVALSQLANFRPGKLGRRGGVTNPM